MMLWDTFQRFQKKHAEDLDENNNNSNTENDALTEASEVDM